MNGQPTLNPGALPTQDEVARHYSSHLETLDRRLTDALTRAKLDGLVIHAGTAVMPARDDQPYPFRVDPLFAQWCPQPEPAGSALVLLPGERPRLLWHCPDDFWHAPPEPPTGSWAQAFDVERVATDVELDRIVNALPGHIGELDSAADPNGVADDARSGTDETAAGAATERVPADVARHHLEHHRAIKTEYEILCIAVANRISATGHAAAQAAFAEGCSEFEIDARYMAASHQRCEDLPYPNIVALNEHAATLHYQRLQRRPVRTGNTLLIDAGARFRGYAADITRTTLHRSSPLRELRTSLEAMQQKLCGNAVAGVEYVALNEQAHELLAEVLVAHGIVRASVGTAFESGITRVFLPHGLGHLLGLQVHDVGGWQRDPDGPPSPPPELHPFLRLTRRLEPGFVVTIEPGIYFIESLYQALSAEKRALIDHDRFALLQPHGGLRIEDDVAVTESDNINLTRAAFAALNTRH